MSKKDFLLSEEKAYPARLVKDPSKLKVLSNPLAWKIFNQMSEPSCPIDIARDLGIHEQKVYYYIRKLREEGLIEEKGREERQGTVAKFYQIKDSAFGLLTDGAESEKISVSSPTEAKSLEPFIQDGRMNSRIIVGSPDPHGPYKARASDSCCAIDLALFLGSFTSGNNLPNYQLDVEVRNKKGNLILVGGPTVNLLTHEINKKLPIHFDLKNDIKIHSELSGKDYTGDECGIITVTENPEDSNGKILVLAGKRFPGTRASVIGLIKNLEKVFQGNKFDSNIKSRVVRGYDVSGDGVVDTSEIIE